MIILASPAVRDFEPIHISRIPMFPSYLQRPFKDYISSQESFHLSQFSHKKKLLIVIYTLLTLPGCYKAQMQKGVFHILKYFQRTIVL